MTEAPTKINNAIDKTGNAAQQTGDAAQTTGQAAGDISKATKEAKEKFATTIEQIVGERGVILPLKILLWSLVGLVVVVDAMKFQALLISVRSSASRRSPRTNKQRRQPSVREPRAA